MAVSDKTLIRYDEKAINADVPIRDVLERYAGIKSNAKGGMVHCPSPQHVDNKPSAKIYDKGANCGNNCFCFSCSKSFTAITVVMEHTGKQFPEACQELIDTYNLPMSRYSNINEIEIMEEMGERNEIFPLSSDDCEILELAAPYETKIKNEHYEEELLTNPNAQQYFVRPSLLQMWENDKKSVEEMLLGICADKKQRVCDKISAETTAFNEIYALHTTAQWNEANKLVEAVDKYGIDAMSKFRLSDNQRGLIADVRELHGICEIIAEYEDRIIAIEGVENKIVSFQASRGEHSNGRERTKTEKERD